MLSECPGSCIVLYPVHLLALVPTSRVNVNFCWHVRRGCGERAINLAPVSSSSRKLKREGGGESRERVSKDHGTRGQHGSSVHVVGLYLVGNGTEKSQRPHREKYRYRICLPFQEARKLFKYYYRSTVYLTAVTAGTKQRGRGTRKCTKVKMVGGRPEGPRPAHSHVLQWNGIDAIRLTSDNTDHESLHG